MRRPILSCLMGLVILLAPRLRAQDSPPSNQVQVVEVPGRRAEPPPADASFEDLIERGDQLRAEKAYLDALDYYHAALAKKPNDASVHNRIGIAEMQIEHWRESEKEFERAINDDHDFADAYNNLGVDYYELKRYGKAIKLYETAIRLRGNSAPYYTNLGAAYFSKKEIEKAAEAYAKALQLDPDVLEHDSRTGVSARLPSPEDRGYFDYVMAKLYAKAGVTERSLEHLRRAMEEGYKKIDDVYKDTEFTEVRKDPRFTQMMAGHPPAIPE
jgi:tetratricopeptide (TPR) repeat protein